MNVKTLTAPTIHAALVEARRLLGDDVVLLESVPPRDGAPARITVMTDRPQPKAQPAPFAAPAPAKPVAATASAAPAAGFGYQGAHRRLAAAAEENARAVARFSGDGGVATLPVQPTPGGPPPENASVPALRSQGTPARGRLFGHAQAAVPAHAPAHDAQAAAERLEELLQAQLTLVHERLALMERRFEKAIIGAGQRWTVHPLFGKLLDQGMRPETITRLFQSLADKGYQPDTNDETLRWALAQELRRHIDLASPKRATGTQLFIGPSGAGKTSLLLKLATHPGFFGRRRTTVIVVEPPADAETFFQSPVELYRRHGLPVQSVSSAEEMQRALDRVAHFDQIMIDTPPLPTREAPARKALTRLKQLVDPVLPLHVHLVLDATRALDAFEAAYLQRLPLRPDSVALTHLDESLGWGRIAEWMMALQLPVQFVSTSSRVPDGVAAFSPAWFVEEMMQA